MDPAPYQYHVLEESRLPDVQFLFREVFHKDVSINYLRAKYDTSWCGVRHLCYLAYQGEQVVAFYGALPQEFLYQGKRLLAAHTCDSITLPAHQRKGLHKALALRTYDLMRAHDIQFVYAFHSENTYHSCKKLDWQEGATMRGFWVSTGGVPWGKAARKLALLKKWHHRRIQKSLNRFPRPQLVQQWQAAAAKAPLQVHYRPAFFAYKSFTQNTICEFGGARFWIKCDAVLSVGAVQFDDPEQLAAGLQGLRRLGRRLGLSQILFQTAPGSALNQWLEQHYPGFDTWLVGYLPLTGDFPYSDWEMRFGDLDTF